MKKIIAIAGSSSSTSINKKFVTWAASEVQDAEVEVLDLNDLEVPIYSMDREKSDGIPDLIKEFVEKVSNADGLLLSLAEHNGSYATAFKNVVDWASRHEKDFWANKKMLLMGTSPGGRGALTVTSAAAEYFPRLGADIVARFNLPKFYDNFENGIQDTELKEKFSATITEFQKSLS